MKNLFTLLLLTLTHCASTAKDRYKELTEVPATGINYKILVTSDNSKIGQLAQRYSINTYALGAGSILVNTNFYYGPFGDISLGLIPPEN